MPSGLSKMARTVTVSVPCATSALMKSTSPASGYGLAVGKREPDGRLAARLATLHLLAVVEKEGGGDRKGHLDRVEPRQRGQRAGVGSDQRADVGAGEADDPGEGRRDLGIGQLQLLALERAVQPGELALGPPELGLGDVELALRDGLALHELRLAVPVDLGEPPLRLGGRDRPLDLGDGGPVGLVLDAVEHRPGLDLGPFLRERLLEVPRDPGPDLHLLRCHDPAGEPAALPHFGDFRGRHHHGRRHSLGEGLPGREEPGRGRRSDPEAAWRHRSSARLRAPVPCNPTVFEGVQPPVTRPAGRLDFAA